MILSTQAVSVPAMLSGVWCNCAHNVYDTSLSFFLLVIPSYSKNCLMILNAQAVFVPASFISTHHCCVCVYI